jgi:hypothetical protein
MNVEYERAIEDLVEFNLFHEAQSPSLQKQILLTQVISAFLVILLSLSGIYFFTHQLSLLTFIPCVLGGIYIFFRYPHIHRASQIRTLRKLFGEGDNTALLGHQVVSVSPEGIFTQSQAGESKLNWQSIYKVAQNNKYVFLYIGTANAIGIPKTAFPTEQALQEFLNYINTHGSKKSESLPLPPTSAIKMS